MMSNRFHVRLSLALLAGGLSGCQAIAQSTAHDQPVPSRLASRQIAVGAKPHGIASVGGFIYNSDTGAGQISVIDAQTDEVVTRVPMPAGGVPGYIRAFHDGRHALVLDTARGVLMVVDPAAGHQIMQTVLVGKGPDKLVIAPNDRDLSVSLTDESQVVMLSFEADRSRVPTRKTFGVGAVAGGAFKHRAIAASGNWLLVPNSGDNHASLINSQSGETRWLKGGNDPGPVALGEQFGRPTVALVGFKASNTVLLHDLSDNTALTLSGLGQTPGDMVVDPELKRAFVSMTGSNEVAVIDYAAKTVVGRVAVGARPVHVTLAPEWVPQDKRALQHEGARGEHEIWVGNDDGGSISVIDGEAMRVKATVQTGAGHHKMAFYGSKAYVSNLNDSTVSVIDRSTLP